MAKKEKAPGPIQPMPPIKVGNPHPPSYTAQAKTPKPKKKKAQGIGGHVGINDGSLNAIGEWNADVQEGNQERNEAISQNLPWIGLH